MNLKKQLKLFVFFISALLLSSCNQENKAYITNQGKVFGTYYKITYEHPKAKNLQELINSSFEEFNNSLSTFSPTSIISRINQNDKTVLTDDYFNEMFVSAMQISEVSHGAFDITVAPLVNAWGFGTASELPKNKFNVDSILDFVGYQKVNLVDYKIIKEDSRTLLDASAIAKGQACDVIGRVLEKEGCRNFMVEIGGEIFCQGINQNGEKWHIGIDRPAFNSFEIDDDFQAIIAISDVGMATSGNYRQFYVKDGKRYAHTIDPRTGYPVDHNLLSATVLAPSCMVADAYATAFMVLGVEESMQLVNEQKDLECFLIFSDANETIQTIMSDGFKQYLIQGD